MFSTIIFNQKDFTGVEAHYLRDYTWYWPNATALSHGMFMCFFTSSDVAVIAVANTVTSFDKLYQLFIV